MGCTIAMALLALCPFSLANEPVSPLAQGGDRRSPTVEWIDQRANGVVDPVLVVQRRAVSERRGRITVRPRG